MNRHEQQKTITTEEIVAAAASREASELRVELALEQMDFMCVGCGCTKLRACPGGCSWIAYDEASGTGICSRCVDMPLEQLIEQARRIFSA
jgi:hypothetical protein